MFAAALVSLILSAQPAAPAVPAAEAARLAAFAGDWTCEGHVPDAKERAPNLRVAVEKVLGGTWVSMRVYQGDQQHTEELLGFDVDRKVWRHVVVSPGGSWTYTGKRGEGDALVFTSDPPSSPKERSTFLPQPEGGFLHRLEVSSGRKGFKVVFEKKCARPK
jgi:hypothetical protein